MATTRTARERPSVPDVDDVLRALANLGLIGTTARDEERTGPHRSASKAEHQRRPDVPNVDAITAALVAVSLYGEAVGGDPLERKQRAHVAAQTLALLRAWATPYPESVRNFRNRQQLEAQADPQSGQSFLAKVKAYERRMKGKRSPSR